MTDIGASAPATFCEATVAQYPQQVALRTPGGAVTITWRKYAGRVRQLAAGLARLGVPVGVLLAVRS
jgi:long-chain acyl-CoA synthetase